MSVMIGLNSKIPSQSKSLPQDTWKGHTWSIAPNS